jgi:tetratricopeptide (TPR) repeat protein
MLIDDLPAGATLLERLQWQALSMQNLHASKMANRLVQLFGRINRGRNDYGVFLINGRDANNWLRNERNLGLLPDLLKKQILLGQHLHEQEGLREAEAMLGVIDQIIDRDENWIEYYGNSIEGLQIEEEAQGKADAIESRMTDAALAEVRYMSAVWGHDHPAARNALETQIEDTRRADSGLAGWHNLWIGQCLEREGDVEAAWREYERARSRLPGLALPRRPRSQAEGEAASSPFEEKLRQLLMIESPDTFKRELRQTKKALHDIEDDGASSGQREEAIRFFGELLGFAASRPDNDEGAGPDVLWVDQKDEEAIGFDSRLTRRHPPNTTRRTLGRGTIISSGS